MIGQESTGGCHGRRGLLFTDLDGTLLDHDSFRASSEALSLVAELRGLGVWTIPVTSKTAVELNELVQVAGLAPLAVAEGGAVIVNQESGCRVVGRRRSTLVRLLDRLRREGFPVRGMSEMSLAEVSDRTGLGPVAAERAMARLASEPFTIERTDGLEPGWEAELVARARAAGAEVARGGRLWHLLGLGVDKGTGVAAIRQLLDPDGRLTTGGVGDAWNDLPMLEAVDVAYLLGRRVADCDVPVGVRRIAEEGPAGFCVAGLDFLSRLAGCAGIRS